MANSNELSTTIVDNIELACIQNTLPLAIIFDFAPSTAAFFFVVVLIRGFKTPPK